MKDKKLVVVIFTFTFSLKSFIQREKIKTKTDKIYNLGVGINNNKGISVQGGMYWKIKLKK